MDRIDRGACAHEYEVTDACGLAIVCRLCKKHIGALNHRRHAKHWLYWKRSGK